ncbi:MAG: 30S ribosomal protein S17 [Patescibacteria group bacterium]|nr:30S ribosomal protein S17 [Patescibacteria group bacterium]
MSIFGKKTEDKKTAATVKAVSSGTVKTVKAGEGKTLEGVVVSTKMKDTVVVRVDRFVKVPKYERFIKVSKRYKAHDAGNMRKEGDKVTIIETRPISRGKNFIVSNS